MTGSCELCLMKIKSGYIFIYNKKNAGKRGTGAKKDIR